MRPEARFHDGTPLTAHDVAWSITVLKEKGHPIITQQLRDCKGAEAVDDRTVVVRFAENRARDVPLFVAGLPIFSRNYYSSHEFDQSTLEAPVGSGPYKVGRFEAGHHIEFERVKEWWGADLPVSRGLNNFDVIRYEYYRDRDVGFEGFTAKNYLFREEFTSRTWATRYNFPAIKDGRVKRDVIPDATPSGAQGWFINMRREKFKDRRLREALIDAFDFEWTNRNIMYGSYDRTQSVFENSPMKASGKPSAAELALLEPFRNQVPEEVFGEPYVPPVTDGSGQDRRWLRRAAQLLNEAEIKLVNGKRVLPNGQPFDIEFLLDEPTFKPHHLTYIKIWKFLASPRPCASSIRCNTGGVSTTPTSILRQTGWVFRPRPEIHCGPISRRSQRPSRARRIEPVSPIRWSIGSSTSSSPPRHATISSRRAGRSTESFARADTGFRIGSRRRIGLPIGTSLDVPPHNPAIFGASPILGGMIKAR